MTYLEIAVLLLFGLRMLIIAAVSVRIFSNNCKNGRWIEEDRPTWWPLVEATFFDKKKKIVFTKKKFE